MDALVSDEPLNLAEMEDRPLVPPGLVIPPGLANISRPSSRPQSRLGNIVPALPKMPPPGLGHGTPTPDQSPRKSETPDDDAKTGVKALGSESGPSRETSTPAQQLKQEDFPSLGSVKDSSRPATPTPTPTPKPTSKAKRRAEKLVDRHLAKTKDDPAPGPAPASSSTAKAAENKGAESKAVEPMAEVKKAERVSAKANKVEKKRLAAINTLITKAGPKVGEMSASTEKSVVESSVVFPPLPAPGTAVSSPITRTAPKTLRVVSTPKTESAPPASPALTLASVAHSTVSRAMSASYRPETPGSEIVSDTASVVSTSITHSRASSPPPTRVGTAAVRTTTKSQLKKARKEVLKQETKAIADAVMETPEEHAPVIGRKKKQKKEKPAKAILPSPAKAASKQTKETVKEAAREPIKEQPKPPTSVVMESISLEPPVEEVSSKKQTTQKRADRGKGKDKEVQKAKEPEVQEEAMPPPPPPRAASPSIEAAKNKLTPATYQAGPASIFQEIRNSLWTSSVDKLQFLKPYTTYSPPHQEPSMPAMVQQVGHCLDCSCKCGEILDEDLAALRRGTPVRKQFHIDGSRMLITPNGDCVRGLTAEEEDSFLELQGAISESAENPGCFVAPRHMPGTGAFSLIKGRAVPNGRPNIFPPSSRAHLQDPIGKLQREDALNYINQYVLPRLNLGSTNMGFPKGSSIPPSAAKDAAAASLNSLAPYFYGPDAAAGVGIYTPPPEGSSRGAGAGGGMSDFSASSGVGSSAGLPTDERPPPPVGKNSVGTTPGGMPLMSVEDAESALAAAKRETEKLEKGLNQVIRRNRRLILGAGS